MKNLKRIVLVAALSVLSLSGMKAVDWDAGLDLTSTYVWRGVAYSGPSIQPYVEMSAGSFAIGAWGSQGFDGFQEMDLYLGYEFDFGLYLGLTDYYYPGTKWGHISDSTMNHAFEINASYTIGSFSIAANLIPMQADGAGAAGSDLYFELGYEFENGVSVFAGAGDGWHTSSGDFEVVNVGMSYSKEIKITDSWSLPVGGSVILNPSTEQFHIVGTISF